MPLSKHLQASRSGVSSCRRSAARDRDLIAVIEFHGRLSPHRLRGWKPSLLSAQGRIDTASRRMPTAPWNKFGPAAALIAQSGALGEQLPPSQQDAETAEFEVRAGGGCPA
jgi:hypothetical protein